MATILSVANLKGGSGKTTTAINLTSGLMRMRYRVLVIDLDTQASFYKWNQRRKRMGYVPFDVRAISNALIEETVEEIRASPDYDIVVIDCPGNMSDIMQRAVKSSDVVVCPLASSFFDLDATVAMAAFMVETQKQVPDIRYMVLHNRKHASRALDKGALADFKVRFGSMPRTFVLDTEIADATPLVEFGGSGLDIWEFAPKAPVGRSYTKLTQEIVECLNR